MATWPADGAERVLPLFTSRRPRDDRPRRAIDTGRAWARGQVTVGQARAASVAAHAGARDVSDEAARAAARAAGHAVGTAHVADHSLGAARHAIEAVSRASSSTDAMGADEAERQLWQREHLPAAVRDLVMSARAARLGLA